MERDLKPTCAVCGHEFAGVKWYDDPFLGWMAEPRCSARCHAKSLRARYEWQLKMFHLFWDEDLHARSAPSPLSR